MSAPDSRAEALLRQFVTSRSEDAFHELYVVNAPRMYLLAKRLTGGREAEAQDAVQEAWLRVASARARFNAAASVSTFLCGVVVNCVREQRRRVSREDGERTDERFVQPRETIDLERAVRELPEGFRDVLVLHDIYGYTHDEIASMCGIDAGTSKSQLYRARERVRERMSEVVR